MNPREGIQVGPDYYYGNYDSKERFCSYWHQIEEITSLNSRSILEIGVGNGFVSNYLKQRRVDVTTLDIDKRLGPNVIGSVLNIPFCDGAFELVACCQVLEHLPYEDFKRGLSEMFRVSHSHALLSLPDSERTYRLCLDIPFIKFRKLISVPRWRKPTARALHFEGYHCWEIGARGYALDVIRNEIEKTGFRIEKTYRVFENSHHRFILLRKTR